MYRELDRRAGVMTRIGVLEAAPSLGRCIEEHGYLALGFLEIKGL